MRKTLALLLVLATAACSPGAQDSAAADARQVSVLPSGAPLAGGPPKPLGTATTLKVGIPSLLEVEVPALLADLDGEFAKENLTVEFVHDTVPNLLTLLGQNKIDLAYAGAQALVFNSLRGGVPIRWVSGVTGGTPDSGLYMRGPATTWDPASLKGKNIGVNPGALAAPSQYTLYAALTRGGLKPADITMTPFNDPASMAQALVSGTIDGGMLGPPYTASVKADAFLAEKSSGSGTQIAGYFATTRLLGEKREAGVAFFRAVERTIATRLTGDYHARPEVMAKVATLLETTAEKLGAAPAVTFDLNVPGESLSRLQEMYRSVPGTLSYADTVQPDELIDLSLVVDAGAGR